MTFSTYNLTYKNIIIMNQEKLKINFYYIERGIFINSYFFVTIWTY